jgi:Cu2+-exporting ATPase
MNHGGHTPDFLSKFWLALVLAVPIFFYSELAREVFGINAPQFPYAPYVLLALGSIVYFYCGWVFLLHAYHELKAQNPGMMTLIAIAVTTAYAYSAVSILAGTGRDLLFELASLIAIMLLGHWIEARSVQSARGALRELAKLVPDTAERMHDGATETVPLADLREGDHILVRPGAKVAADGRVVEGESEVDESIITGESRPVHKAAGTEVIAGSINGDGSLTVLVEKMGERTFLAGIMRLVAEAEASKSRMQLLSDRAAFYLTIIALAAGALTFAAWVVLLQGEFVFAVERVVAVLVIACPHALGLAVPLVAAISTTMAAKSGFLVRKRLALEAARSVDIVLFDKTGTLTTGDFGVVGIYPAPGLDESDVLRPAASVNAHSEHALARAMVAEAKVRTLALEPIADFERIPGKGAKGRMGAVDAVVGSESLFDAAAFSHDARRAEQEGKTVVHVRKGDRYVGAIALADTIRPESREAIRALRDMGVQSAMITGDAEDVAAWVAKEIGLDQYFARVLPEGKAEKVKLLQAEGKKVAMVGDGVNDAPALTEADLGIAIGAGTNVAIESAGIVLMRSDPRDIAKIIRLSRLTYRKMLQNLFWAAGYNVVAIPLAAGVLYAWGILLQPAVAAIFMSLSTVIVAFNAVLLRRRSLET